MLIYIAAVSVLAVILTVYDKYASEKRPRHRIPERVLMLTGALGGAIAMYFVMQLIRHKTQHKKFMIGLPVCIVVHLAIIVVIFFA